MSNKVAKKQKFETGFFRLSGVMFHTANGINLYHWTWNRKGNMVLHAGKPENCKRVHLNHAGVRETKS